MDTKRGNRETQFMEERKAANIICRVIDCLLFNNTHNFFFNEIQIKIFLSIKRKLNVPDEGLMILQIMS